MEGVEDIPGAALSEGIRWDWETFPEYLDALEKMPRSPSTSAAHVPHGSVRAYVMGERGAKQRARHTPDDIEADVRDRARGPRGGRPRLLDLPHHGPPRRGRRARARAPSPSEDELFGIGQARSRTSWASASSSSPASGAAGDAGERRRRVWRCTRSTGCTGSPAEMGFPVSFAMPAVRRRDPTQWRRAARDLRRRRAPRGRRESDRPRYAVRGPSASSMGHQTIDEPLPSQPGPPTQEIAGPAAARAGGAACATPEVRERILGRGGRRAATARCFSAVLDDPKGASHALPDGRPARLRARRPRQERGRHCRARGTARRTRCTYDLHAAATRASELLLLPYLQLRERRAASAILRDVPGRERRSSRSVGRRRPLRAHLRRQRCRPSCSPTGCATGSAASACRSSGPSTARRAAQPSCTASRTAACWRRGCWPTST